MIDCGNFDLKLPPSRILCGSGTDESPFSIVSFFFLFHQVTMAMASVIAGQWTIMSFLMGLKTQ